MKKLFLTGFRLVLPSATLFLPLISKINSYQGDLYIHADNTAEFRQKIVYQFEEDFKGQIVGLGRAGKMPMDLTLILIQRFRPRKMVLN